MEGARQHYIQLQLNQQQRVDSIPKIKKKPLLKLNPLGFPKLRADQMILSQPNLQQQRILEVIKLPDKNLIPARSVAKRILKTTQKKLSIQTRKTYTKPQAVCSVIQAQDDHLVSAFFRYSPVSFYCLLGKRQQLLSYIANPIKQALKGKKPGWQELYLKVVKYAKLKGKYRFRDKFNYLSNQLLKSYQIKISKKQPSCKKKKQSSDSQEEQDNSQARKVPKEKTMEARNLQTWKKLNDIEPKTKIFIIKGGYHDLREALLQRGWAQNPNHMSPYFDLKFTCMINDIQYDNLESHQIVNHFNNNHCLTSKFGLGRSLHSVVYTNQVDRDKFYPRCYDLADLSDFQNFIVNYQQTLAQSILHNFLSNKPTTVKRLEIAIKIIQSKNQSSIIKLENALSGQFSCPTIQEWNLLTNQCTFRQIADLQTYKQSVESLLAKNRQLDPQSQIAGFRNIWIVKPNYLSRGRGIRCMTGLNQILDYCCGKDLQFVVQKYIQTPMIIHNRKFDIRLWAIVQDFSPPKIFIYEQFYLRFCAEDFNIQNISNRFVHLTNNSISKHNNSHKKSPIEGNMWTLDQFKEYLLKIGKIDMFDGMVKKMHEIVIWSIRCCQDQISARKNSFQLFGYDFMLDQQFKPWLIQVNSSPSMQYSTAVTKRLVKMVLDDTVKVIEHKKKSVGLYKLLYKGQQKPVSQFFKVKKK